MSLPHVPVLQHPANPITGGLYDAATITDTLDARHLGGMTVISPNQGAYGTWPADCPVPEDTPDKGGGRPEPEDFPALGVWAADECKTVGSDAADRRSRALHSLRLKEPLAVEKHVAGLLGDITPAASVSDIVAAVSHLEEELSAHGFLGVVHARHGLLAVAEKASMIVRQGSRMLTPGGHVWAFGGGYTALGDTLVGTGPVIIRRSPVTEGESVALKVNNVINVAERVISVGWDQPTAAVTITKEP